MGRKRRKLYGMALVLLLAALSGCSGTEKESDETVVLQEETNETEVKQDAAEKEEDRRDDGKEMIVVYVCGQVHKEGVVTLPAGSRIYQAIEMAGGVTEDAQASWLNLAEVLTDGARIYVPGKDEVSQEGTEWMEGSGSAAQGTADGRVNLNRASKEELMTLPGIGEAKAEAILQYRTEHGGFGSIDEIKQISGIKDGVFEKIKDKITV